MADCIKFKKSCVIGLWGGFGFTKTTKWIKVELANHN